MYTKTAETSNQTPFPLIMKTILVTPALAYIPSYLDALREGHRLGSSAVKTPDDIAKIENDSQAFLDDLLGPKPATRINELGKEVERVPQSMVWLIEDGVFVGDAGIRHKLTPELEISGGHIGYGVRPSFQGKGYATDLLRHCLTWVREHLHLDRIMLTCRTDNEASARVIEKNGGVLIDITPHPYVTGMTQKRYWIAIPSK
ncbi:MAG: family N-acetyltransferase [Alphaproteobacteria bacterium]|jgi:predicted acetyltransferase|nr:family N-acetyltransferase [Alphaproteobacteria bacterium]